MLPHAQNAGASTVHLHACSTTLSPHSTSARLLIAPFMPLLIGADLMAGRHAEEVQQVLMRLRGRRLPQGMRTRPHAGARASTTPCPRSTLQSTHARCSVACCSFHALAQAA